MPLYIDTHRHIEGITKAAIAVHRESHGLLADEISEVVEGA